MDKNISPDRKSNQLAELLNENMKKSGTQMNKARVRLISMVILALCKVQTVSFHKLALAVRFHQQNINIFMPGIAYRNVAFPLMFTMLDKKGNSSSEERIALVDRFIRPPGQIGLQIWVGIHLKYPSQC